MRLRIFITTFIILFASTIRGEEILRPISDATSVEWGSSKIIDTYLSPLKYSGWRLGLDHTRYRATAFSPERYVVRLHLNGAYESATSPAGNSKMQGVLLTSDCNLLRRFAVAPRLTVAAGAGAQVVAGALYNPRNGNNPVNAKAIASINLTGFADYGFKVWRIPVTVRYTPTLPVTGAFFSPQYGELYYEIYEGNRSGLVHGAWWGRQFRFDHSLTADFRVGASSLRIGYRGEYLSQKVNSLVSRSTAHMLTLGVTTDWLPFNPSKPLSKSVRIVNPIGL